MNLSAIRHAALALTCAALTACATTPRIDLDSDALAAAIESRPIVLLGEVHDNAAQHAVRAAALMQVLQKGARPAIAFEQFDREMQPTIDRVRRETPPAGISLAEYVIVQATGKRPGWNWNFYRPYVELALQYDLPIVAANLSRKDAERVARDGYGAVFDAAAMRTLGLDRVPPAVLQEQEHEVDRGHCHQMPAEWLPRLARAQIARDAVLAQSIRPYFGRGVVLLTGDGHVRDDIGVPRYLTAAERARTVTIGLVEQEHADPEWLAHFDVAFVTPTQARADPCESLKKHPMR
jgi:uncharacterized iron-regulated protein